jgi:hypothetical protein
LDRAQMRRFRRTINELLLDELFLHDRLFTWSNRRGNPTTSRLARSKEQELIDLLAARVPTWKAHLLNLAGRATLVQSTLSAIPVHVSICCSLSAWALKGIDKIRRGFLWAGAQSAAGGACKVAWPIVTSPRELGGLGIPDLRFLRLALRLRWEWKRRESPEEAWARLPAPAEQTVALMFQASTTFSVGNGERALFWTDAWLPQGRLCYLAPAVFQAVPRRWRRRTVREALHDSQWARDGAAASTITYMSQFIRLWSILDGVQLDPSTQDSLVWRWTTDGAYSSASAYRVFFPRTRHSQRSQGALGCPLPTQSEVLLLDCPPWTSVDRGTPHATWPPTNRRLRPLRPARRARGPPAALLPLLYAGLVRRTPLGWPSDAAGSGPAIPA